MICNNSFAETTSSDEYLNKALEAYNNKNYTETIEILDKALKNNSSNYKYYYLRGDAKHLTRNFKGAVDDFSKALYYNPMKMTPQKIAQKYIPDNKSYSTNIETMFPDSVRQQMAQKMMSRYAKPQYMNISPEDKKVLNEANYKFEAPIYYKRALSRIEINQTVDAAEDLNTAKKMYQTLNDTNQVEVINNKLKELNINIE